LAHEERVPNRPCFRRLGNRLSEDFVMNFEIIFENHFTSLAIRGFRKRHWVEAEPGGGGIWFSQV